jgi:hypothetical protein
MKGIVNRELSKGLRIAAIAIVVTGSVAAPATYSASTAYATPPNDPVVAPPKDLAEMARQTGEPKLLHETPDAKTLPYIEHEQRAPAVKMRDKARDRDVELGIAGAG